MTSQIRDVTHEDLDAVLALNNAAVPHVNSLDFKELDLLSICYATFLP